MRIGIQTWGSEGDIRPTVALASGLAGRGHTVTLVVTGPPRPEHHALAERAGFALRATTVPGLETQDDLDRLLAAWIALGHPVRQARMILAAAVDPAIDGMTAAARELSATNDIVIGHFFVHPLPAAAERAGVPWVALHVAHTGLPSREICPPGMPSLGPLGHRIGWALSRVVINRLFRARVNRSRAAEGLAPIRDVMAEAWASPVLTLLAVSPVVCSRPADWPPSHHVCGVLDLPAGEADSVLPDPLQQFLDAGDPPVYFTFGSLLPQGRNEARAVADVWHEATRRAGCRAVLQLPVWADAGPDATGRTLVLHRAPHAAAFPRCAAVVHHGGAGTVHATLAAGVPSIVVPHVADQFFWAAEMRRLGAAGPFVPRTRLSAPALGRAIADTLSTPALAARARELAPVLRRERGVERACDLVDTVLSGVSSRTQEVIS